MEVEIFPLLFNRINSYSTMNQGLYFVEKLAQLLLINSYEK